MHPLFVWAHISPGLSACASAKSGKGPFFLSSSSWLLSSGCVRDQYEAAAGVKRGIVGKE